MGHPMLLSTATPMLGVVVRTNALLHLMYSFRAATKGAHIDGAFTIPRDRDGGLCTDRCASATGAAWPAKTSLALRRPKFSNTVATRPEHSAPPPLLVAAACASRLAAIAGSETGKTHFLGAGSDLIFVMRQAAQKMYTYVG